ncbi:hypothetical protein [Candidatus Vidania fulgoroideorum]
MSRKAFYPILLRKIKLYSKKKLYFIGLNKNNTNFSINNLYLFRLKNKLFILTNKISKVWGTYYSVIKNLFYDNVLFFKKVIILNGIEFKVRYISNHLFFNLGFSNIIKLNIPKFIYLKISKNLKKIKLFSSNREFLGNFCEKILKLKKFNFYKDKGIRFLYDIKKIKEKKKK